MGRGKILIAALLLSVVLAQPVRAEGWLSGDIAGLNPVLKTKLLQLHKAFGKPVRVTPHGGCRRHGSRRAPKSWHRRAVGCKAADIVMPGIARHAILNWWARHVGGGRGFYCGRRFVHVDIGPNRRWSWYCGNRTTRLARR